VSELETVPYEPEWRERVRQLHHEVFGASASAEEFDWWFERNPAGPRVISLVPDGERAAGAASMSFFRMRLNGDEADAAVALDIATHPDFRGRGVFSTLQLLNEDVAARAGAQAALGFTNPEAGPIYVGKLGWRELTWLRIWARPLLLPARKARGVEPLERFGPETDELYERARGRWANHVVRRSEHLNWRFLDSPRSYRAFAARRGDRLDGYAVLGHKVYAGRSVGVVADLVASPGAARALLRQCVLEVTDGQALVALVSPWQQRTFLAAGFLPTHRSIRFIGKPLQPGVTLASGRAAWHFTLGDMDIF